MSTRRSAAIPAGKVIGIMNDTVIVDDGPRALPPRTGPDSAADLGVRLN